MQLCTASGTETIQLSSSGDAIKVSENGATVSLVEKSSRGLVGGISKELTSLKSRQASEARDCAQKHLDQVLNILLGPANFAPNPPSSGAQESNNDAVRECDRLAAAPGNRDNPNHMKPVFYRQLDIGAGLRACTRALKIEPGNPRIAFQLARIENKIGRYDEARRRIAKLVAIKYPPAFGERGDNYLYGDGIPVNVSAALKAYRLGVELGDGGSADALAVLYREGTQVKRDFAKAKKYAEIAHRLTHPNGAFILGAMYREGQGVPVDLDKSRKLLSEAVSSGATSGHYSLAILQDEGKGGDSDYEAAGKNLFKSLQLQAFDEIVERILKYQNGADAWNPETMASLQRELAAAGYYSGSIDGVVGPGTKKAIRDYYNR